MVVISCRGWFGTDALEMVCGKEREECCECYSGDGKM